MGADSVVGLDIDETALWVAFETAQQQEWASRVSFVLGPVECIGDADFDIVMCNMITSSFLPLVSELRRRLAPAGIALFSGLLASEVGRVSEVLMEAGFVISSHRVHGDWASLVAAAVATCHEGGAVAARGIRWFWRPAAPWFSTPPKPAI